MVAGELIDFGETEFRAKQWSLAEGEGVEGGAGGDVVAADRCRARAGGR